MASVNVQALHVDDSSDVFVDAGEAIFVNGPTTSDWSPLSRVFVDAGRLGGTGRIDMHGEVSFTGGSVLTSINAPGGTSYAGGIGVLEVASDGEVRVDDSALALYTRYRIEIDGEMSVNNNAFVAADYGTATVIEVSGSLRFLGDGGYYRGFPVAGQPLSHIGNHGLLEKATAAPTVVDAWYVQAGTAEIEINCCDRARPARRRPGSRRSSGRTTRCATGSAAALASPASVPHGSTRPSTRAASRSTSTAATPRPRHVTLQELAQPPDTTDSRAIGNEVFAHADQLDRQPGEPRHDHPPLLAGRRDGHAAG